MRTKLLMSSSFRFGIGCCVSVVKRVSARARRTRSGFSALWMRSIIVMMASPMVASVMSIDVRFLRSISFCAEELSISAIRIHPSSTICSGK